MHVSSENTRGSGRLSVFFEQDLCDNDNSSVENNNVKSERVAIRRVANDSLDIDANNNDSILSSELNESNERSTATPPPVMRRHKSGRQTSRSRERSFVNAANAVVGGARSVARSIKRISLIESSNANSSSVASGGSFSNIRERTAQESSAQDGVDQLKANAKHRQHYNSTPSLQSYAQHSAAPLQPSGSAHSLGSTPNPSPRSQQSKTGSVVGVVGSAAGVKGVSTAKHDQQTSAAAAAAISSTAAAAGTALASTSAGGATGMGAGAASATPPEKEKKRKEVSSSRVKKFHRHFSQVSKDEKLINYFSCALVGDIPLQGHLYITEQHFAFYSNVFGYVTKVVIPTSSVTKISKEKTAKIIPNAVGVATADERHVFGSFISREAAFRLMCTVCTQLSTGNEILPKPLPVDVELTEEYLLDDDSSCSISGNESPPHLRSAAAAAAAAAAAEQESQLRQRSSSDRHSDLPGKSTLAASSELGQVTIRSSAPPVVHYEEQTPACVAAVSQPTSSTASNNSSVPPASAAAASTASASVASASACGSAAVSSRSSLRARLSRQLPTLTELHVLYLGIMLAIMLALFSVFLLYRILDIEAKTHLYNTPVDFNLVRQFSQPPLAALYAKCFALLWQRTGNDEDIFAEALRWQKELQDKSTAEAQHILSKNLEQISKVRRSLETLSMLIHDRRAGYVQSEAAAAAATATATATELQMDVEAVQGSSGSTSSSIPSD
ncbi:hypothetical protein KR093_004137 [Drosophila rubida]|uniref:GRAM domain-containing protein n=1 Tax=Drosophila rubida TaxID=30044 RepID=A0AAD4KCL7_9MUSC|nr:hypothetical protein KR093_004137 [Drosophila rubida]